MKKMVLIVSISVFVIIAVIILSFLIYFNTITHDIELNLNKLKSTHTSIMLDCEDNIINDDSYIAYDEIPKTLIDAFIAIEDKRYFSHNGIDVKRMISASFYNISHGKRAQGASTITQQLIKNTHLSSEKTIDRKLKEIKLALSIEKYLTKEQILEKYLNSLYFGSGIYGVKNAAKYIFNKDISDLSISECATIAGIIKAPTYYSPLNDKDRSLKRRNIVLDQMLENKAIDIVSHNSARSEELIINNALINSNLADNYIKQTIYEASILLNMPIDNIVNGNYKIATYYDNSAQNLLYNTAASASPYVLNNNYMLTIADNNSNGIVGLCTNLTNINIFEYKRQVGSVIKPIAVYLPALEEGIIHACSKYNDAPIEINGYTPHNYHDKYRGRISVREAIKHSSNVIAVQVMNELGIEKAKDYLNNMNINITDNGLSVALGGLIDGLSCIDIMGAYMCMANLGTYAEPTFIRYIEDSNGTIIYRNNHIKERVFNESSSYIMTDILRETAIDGTAKKLNNLPFDIASKTGTVASPIDDNRNIDAYNISYTTKNTIFSWIGGDLDNDVTGGGLPTILARNIYEKLYKIYPENFNMPDSVKVLLFDKYQYDKNGKIILNNDLNESYSDIFDIRYLPTEHVVVDNDIEYKFENGHLTLNNIQNTDIKIYKTDVFKNKNLYSEIKANTETIIIPIHDTIFDKYTVEIYYNDKIIKILEL